MGCAVPVKAAEVWLCLLWVFSRAANPQQCSILLSLGTCEEGWPCGGPVRLLQAEDAGEMTPSAKDAQVILIMLSVQMGGPEEFC